MKVKVNQKPQYVVAVGVQGPAGLNTITTAGDVDSVDLQDGSVLVYRMVTQKWTSTTKLDAQDVEAGEF